MRHTALVALLVVLLSACAGGPPPSAGVSPAAALQGSWKLVQGSADGRPIPIVPRWDITLTGRGAQIQGTSACNSYGGAIVPDPLGPLFKDVAVTAMACEGAGVMESESAYLAALGRVTDAQRQGDDLILAGPGVQLRFEIAGPIVEDAG